MGVQKAERVWQSVLGELQLHITRPSYETWLKDTVGLDHGDQEFVIGAPNAFVAEMLEQRMYSLISHAIERVAGQSLDLRFKVVAPNGTLQSPTNGVPGITAAPADSVGSSSATANGTNGAGAGPGPVQTTTYDFAPGAHGRNETLNSRYTFDSFIVGKANELAHAAAHAVADNPGLTYNPLFIYSGVGLGKTHLLHAIGHQVRAKGLALIFATTEQFTNEYIKAIRDGKAEDFRNRYRSADVLLLDDIQFIIGKEQTQEGFFHTFNTLHMAARQIVITSDRPATELTVLEDRVRSRLAGGLIVDIQPPDLETRLAILRTRAAETGQRFTPDVLEFLAERIHQNVRELEGCLNRVAAFAHLVGRPITLELVKAAIADTLHSGSRRRVTDHAVIDAVCAYFDVDQDVLKGRLRDKHTALARQVAMYLLREEGNLPFAAIGHVLGGKDHSTVMHACQRISKQITVDTHLRRDVTNLRESLIT